MIEKKNYAVCYYEKHQEVTKISVRIKCDISLKVFSTAEE